MEFLLDKDITLFIYLNNLGTVQWDGFWLFISNKFSAIPLYLFLLFLSYKKFGLKSTLLLLLVIVLLITASDETSNLFKNYFKRLRPCHDESIAHLARLVQARCGGLYAFFSAHASNSMAIAVFFGLLLKKNYKYLFLLLLFWAIMVGYSRVYLGVHFPLDVLTGMALGAIYALLFHQLFTWITNKITS
jgi:undecaprenyl-diphosphatase